MSNLIKIPPLLLKEIDNGDNHMPSLYYHPNSMLRYFFWARLAIINRLINQFACHAKTCLDFGGGDGVFLPTLSKRFNHVYLVDLDTTVAKEIVKRFQIKNVTLIEADILSDPLKGLNFDTIIATDVLEHFKDFSEPVKLLKSYLSLDGILLTSLPTESWIYVLLRAIYRVEKPLDHYHRSIEVERYLRQQCFREAGGRQLLSLAVFLYPVFSIKAWKITK